MWNARKGEVGNRKSTIRSFLVNKSAQTGMSSKREREREKAKTMKTKTFKFEIALSILA